MIAIIDYDAGNIKSVEKAMHYLSQEVEITRDQERILAADKVWREYRFFDTVPASRAGYEGEAAIMIQGVADCLFEKDGAGVLLDYKTDYATPEELKERYATQLSLYRKALSPLFPKGIKECILYSLANNCPILVE